MEACVHHLWECTKKAGTTSFERRILWRLLGNSAFDVWIMNWYHHLEGKVWWVCNENVCRVRNDSCNLRVCSFVVAQDIETQWSNLSGYQHWHSQSTEFGDLAILQPSMHALHPPTCCFHDFVTLFTHVWHVLMRSSCKVNVSGV
jgi:hypothetical protein